jgi:hypothetical protein
MHCTLDLLNSDGPPAAYVVVAMKKNNEKQSIRAVSRQTVVAMPSMHFRIEVVNEDTLCITRHIQC